MSNQKSTTLIAIGVAVFLIAGGALFFLVQHNNKSTPKSATLSRSAVSSTTIPGASAISTVGTPSVAIPKGDNAVSMQMEYFAGVGGYVRPNDLINIYVVVNKDCKDTHYPLTVKLMQSNVKVLQVLGQGPLQTGQPTSFLLAETPQQAEALLFLKNLGTLYFTLTNDASAAAATTGVSCSNGF